MHQYPASHVANRVVAYEVIAANAPTAKLSSVEIDAGALPGGADVEADMIASCGCGSGCVALVVVSRQDPFETFWWRKKQLPHALESREQPLA